MRRFPIRFDPGYRRLSRALLISPERSFLEADESGVRVRMAWAFSARFPLGAIASVTERNMRPSSLGVHGFAGRWLVNGSRDGIVGFALRPGQRARVVGVPVRLDELLVSVDDVAGVVAACGGAAG